MFKTIAEGLAKYDRRLVDFWEWVREVDKSLSTESGLWSGNEWLPWVPLSEPHGWSSESYRKAADLRMLLRGMEEALRLTADEVRDKFRAAGFPVTSDKTVKRERRTR